MTGRSVRRLALVAPLLVTLVVPNHHDAIVLGVGSVLAAMWAAMAVAVATRITAALWRRVSPWVYLDVLTTSGAAMMWTATMALFLAAALGWASLGFVAVLGIGIVLVAATWTATVACGDHPWRRATVARTIVPASAVEGDPLREDIRIEGFRMPLGMRLFVTGRVQRHGAVSRYVVDGGDGEGELLLSSELGPALRGEHRAPPLELWLVDVLGLARTPTVLRGAAELLVLPRPPLVDGVRALLGTARDDAMSVPTQHAPTEGTFRIREYAPGDDTRRIHWVRSMQQQALVVRLPDELPLAEPAVRVILDNDLDSDAMTCRAPDELLDALVRIWLGIGQVLAATGARVTMVAATRTNGKLDIVERSLPARHSHAACLLGARISWQTGTPLADLTSESRDKLIVVSSRRSRLAGRWTWVVVPEAMWTTPEAEPSKRSEWRLPFAIGSPENRASRRELAHRTATLRWAQSSYFRQVVCWIDWSRFKGDHVARPSGARVKVSVIP
jgi:hypothetical protein